MKTSVTLLITLIMLLTSSCSDKPKVKSSFLFTINSKLTSADFALGGIYVVTRDLSSSLKSSYKLDTEDSALIPFGTYEIVVIAFDGVEDRIGMAYCGVIPNITLNSSDISVEVTLSSNDGTCQGGNAISGILLIKKGLTAKFDEDIFDGSFWGA